MSKQEWKALYGAFRAGWGHGLHLDVAAVHAASAVVETGECRAGFAMRHQRKLVAIKTWGDKRQHPIAILSSREKWIAHKRVLEAKRLAYANRFAPGKARDVARAEFKDAFTAFERTQRRQYKSALLRFAAEWHGC